MLEVRLPEANPKAFQLVLDFIYTDVIDPTHGQPDMAQTNEVVLMMMQVYTLAVKFHMYRLEQLCVHYLEGSINLRNVLVALKNASQLKVRKSSFFRK